jgi:hypothetical protein
MSFGQGGAPWGPDDSGSTPDWAALAEASEARARKRRWLMIGGAVVATLAVGSIVAWGIVSANSTNEGGDKPADQLPSTADIPDEGKTKGPSFAATTPPPPLDPNDFIDSAAKDKAPLNEDTLFPGATLTMGGNVYKKGASTHTSKCSAAAQGALKDVLDRNGCTQMIRATYTKGTSAVTVGVAVFDTKAKATKAAGEYKLKGTVVSLPGSGVPTFCRTTTCRQTSNSAGRYVYFTNGGITTGRDATKQDKALFALGDDLRAFTFQQIQRRGQTQASAAATAG